MKILIGVLLSVSLLSATAVAHTPIDRRERHQQQRIRQGKRSGELTRRELVRLETEQAAIRAYERRAKRDGELTFRERRRLDHLLDRSSRDIYRQKHDRRDR